MKRVSAMLVFAILMLACASFAADEPLADLKFMVVKEENGKPVRNASVIMHRVNKDGKQDNAGFQLKTDAEGKTQFSGVPYGKLRVQVIARGLQTYGQDFDIQEPAHEIVIKLKPPQGQYTIYK